MPRLPSASQPKELPVEVLANKEIPNESQPNNIQPIESPQLSEKPEESQKVDYIPEASPGKFEMPSDLHEENCVTVDGQLIEIKPTKLKYFRNKGASAYGIIKAVPLHELLTYGKGVIDEKRDADQLLYDFLVAAFDNSTFVRDHYDDMDADTIDKICKIFGRINHIDEKEEAARKNKEAQAKH